MEKEDRLNLFMKELGSISDTDVKELARLALTKCDDYFFHTPASSSGKYHPLYTLGDGGLVRHTRAVVYFVQELWRSKLFNVSEHECELIILAAIVHDIKKSGDTGGYTVKEHPRLAAEFVRRLNDEWGVISQKDLDYVYAVVLSHMGVWGVKDGLPAPETDAEKLLHLADLMASRKDVDVKFISENTEVSERRPIVETKKGPVEPCNFTMPFGKHKGKTLDEIYIMDGQYFMWCLNNISAGDVLENIKEYMKIKK